MYDVAIIGGGPGGYVAAIKSAQMGFRTCVIEEDKWGGTCLNQGCIPTKALLKSAALIRDLKHAETIGIISKGYEIDLSAMIDRKNEITSRLTSGIEMLLMKNEVTLIRGRARILNRNLLKIPGDGREVKAKNIIIATGSKNMVPPINGVDSECVMYSDDILDCRDIPAALHIIGGGVIGLEMACFMNSIGVKVKVIEAAPNILPKMEKEVIGLLIRKLEESGIEIVCNSRVVEIQKQCIVYEQSNQIYSEPIDKVLISVGRRGASEDLFGSNLGLKMNKGYIASNSEMRTNIPNIFSIGDVNGVSMLAHTAMMEGIVAVENIAGKRRRMDYGCVPSCVFTFPQIASVGMTEDACRAAGKEIKVGRFALDHNGKALVDIDEGLAKVIVDSETEEILGFHMIGNYCTDMITEVVLAMQNELTAREIINTVHPHPTVSEAINEAFMNVVGESVHI